ncbi:MAG: hypothetical protein IJU61_03530 [Victivallales bacterium]|nr:hypothetical protein [Bacteroidales bacterium]MBQ9445640.1 hypothetical protein [Victivallales bacterium]
MEDTLIKLIQKGTCPFTGQRYDCARCEVKPEYHKIPSDQPGMHSIHMSFCITGYVKQMSRKELRRIANIFTMDDGRHPKVDELIEYFTELYKLGVEHLPMCDCKRFCFKHGCMGGDE